tara:strand:- start:158 stop:607 length:450 start_codon:yes stop_codon:yes gene_type:complete
MHKTISFNTKFGWITVEEKNKQILSIKFKKLHNKGKSNQLQKIKKNIKDFLFNKTKTFNPKIVLNGTKLEIKIWKELTKIPYGKTKSYGEIAKKVKTSPRYVGNVCAKNKHLLVIPCHRVIRSDGTLGGFSAPQGINLKRKLLKLEQLI